MKQPSVKLLSWDTACFGYPVGELLYSGNQQDLLNALGNAEAAGFKLIYLKSENPIAFTSAVGHSYNMGYADKKVTFRKNLQLQNLPTIQDKNIEPYTSPEAGPELIQLAIQSGLYSRFARDPHFRHQEYEKLYTQWIQNSVSGEMAAEVWISTTPTGQICGMLTLSKKENLATIGLLAVTPKSRRHGYGKKLLSTACRRALDWGCSAIQVGTQQDNLPACRLYQSVGFSPHHTAYLYHIWI